jgi:hypoxanthine phosphoribosyltransferase
MKEVFVSWQDVERHTQDIIQQITTQNWRPDYIVGITRGGLVPANLISQYLKVPMEALKVSLRDDDQCESNCWMAEDAFGYVLSNSTVKFDTSIAKNILIVDDINDSGATINWIRQDWQRSCLPDDPRWAGVWGNNVRIATLYDNESSNNEVPVSYCSVTVNKHEDPQWIVFPWEGWWK